MLIFYSGLVDTIWHFAHASNMNRRQIEARCNALCYTAWWLDSMGTPFISISEAWWIRVGKPISFPMGIALCGVTVHELNVGLALLGKPSSRISTLKSVGRSKK
jgi:hypothetical protein